MKRLASGEGLLALSSHGRRKKGKSGREGECKREPNLSFYRELTPTITNS